MQPPATIETCHQSSRFQKLSGHFSSQEPHELVRRVRGAHAPEQGASSTDTDSYAKQAWSRWNNNSVLLHELAFVNAVRKCG